MEKLQKENLNAKFKEKLLKKIHEKITKTKKRPKCKIHEKIEK